MKVAEGGDDQFVGVYASDCGECGAKFYSAGDEPRLGLPGNRGKSREVFVPGNRFIIYREASGAPLITGNKDAGR